MQKKNASLSIMYGIILASVLLPLCVSGAPKLEMQIKCILVPTRALHQGQHYFHMLTE